MHENAADYGRRRLVEWIRLRNALSANPLLHQKNQRAKEARLSVREGAEGEDMEIQTARLKKPQFKRTGPKRKVFKSDNLRRPDVAHSTIQSMAQIILRLRRP